MGCPLPLTWQEHNRGTDCQPCAGQGHKGSRPPPALAVGRTTKSVPEQQQHGTLQSAKRWVSWQWCVSRRVLCPRAAAGRCGVG